MIQSITSSKSKHYLSCGFAFCLSLLPPIAVAIMILLLVQWLASGKWKEKSQQLKQTIPILFLGFFGLLVLGMIPTENLSVGLFDLETKLSLLLFPLIIFSQKESSKKQLNDILIAFTSGVFLTTIYCLIRASFTFYETNLIGDFFYSSLGRYVKFHPTYFALYVSLSVFFISEYCLKNWTILSSLKRYLLLSLAIFLLFYIQILSSRVIILAFPLVASCRFMIFMMQRKQIAKGIFLSIIAIGLWFVLALSLPTTSARINSLKERHEKTGQADVRIQIWTAAAMVISESPILGHGTGDVKAELMKKYQLKNYTKPYELKFNAHNQYLQVWIALGLLGLIVFLVCLLYPFFLALGQQEWLYVLFITLFMITLVGESMLEIQRGAMFFSFFHAIFAKTYLVKRVE